MLNEFSRTTRVVLKHARAAFTDPGRIAREWRALNFLDAPDPAKAADQYDHFQALVAAHGSEVLSLPADASVGLDAIYVRDASIVSPRGIILASMGKAARVSEPAAQAAAFERWGVPVVGAIRPPGTLEGGDVVWLDDRTVIVGRGYRTNDDGIRQFRGLLGDTIDECIVVPLPHWRGPSDVFHLMSVLSPIDCDLAVAYSPLMPVPLRERLGDRGMTLVEVPDDEFDTMGANVLALAPRRCLMVDGNPTTRARLEAAGAEVAVYDGSDISLKGGGGPTCLTRPIERSDP